jgi:alpha-beta hydrolase superfamily lysophospholipase
MPPSTMFPIRTHDNLTLLGRRWAASGPPRGSALLIHGVGEHSARYDEVAAVMTDLGLTVVSYDQRGFGKSEGPKGRIPGKSTLVDDAVMVFGMVENEAPAGAPPPFLVAHSMGGTIAAYAVTSKAIRPRGLVLSSPAIQPILNAVEENVLRLLARVSPNIPLDSRIKPDQVTHDEQVRKAIATDHLMHTTVSPRLVVAILAQGADALADAPGLALPTLFLVAGADSLVHAEKSREFANAMRAGSATLHWYDGLFHEVFNETRPQRDLVLKDLKDWFATQL